ncbi:uncharacterized protein LOC141691205 [Apium graveolens]|uniref:uncharacterized protein LOC141691205 n=1 Tax=Apium graveolens TaxID=4045 RepID=UPI003D78DD2B
MSEEIEGVTHMEIRDVKVKDKLFKVSVSRDHVGCSCQKFVMCGIVCRHVFCVENDYTKIEQASLKLTHIWYDFRQAVNKAGMIFEKLDYVHQTIKQLNSYLDDQGGCDVEFTKRDHMAAMVGEQPTEEISVLIPNVCKNKGNYFKRLISSREKAVMKAKKRSRKCTLCKADTHDARRCHKRKNRVAE